MRDRERCSLDIAVDQGGNPLWLTLERDYLVVLSDVHAKEAVQYRFGLIIIGAAGTTVADGFALQVLRLVDVLADRDRPLRLERLADDIFDFRSAERRLRSARRNGGEVEITGQNRSELSLALELDEVSI